MAMGVTGTDAIGCGACLRREWYLLQGYTIEFVKLTFFKIVKIYR